MAEAVVDNDSQPWADRMPAAVSGAIWLAKAVYIIAQPLPTHLLSVWLLDDTFITATIARNVAGGLGYSFDGVNPTTGSPPLWTYLLAPLHALLSPWAAVKGSMILSAFFAAVAGWLVFGIGNAVGGRRLGWLAMGLCVLAAPLFLQAMNGMETGLFTALGVFPVWLRIGGWLEGRPLSRREATAAGVALGLNLLVRADGIFVAAAFIVMELWLARGVLLRRETMRLGWTVAGVAAGLAVLLTWNFASTGSFAPANQAGRRFIAWGDVFFSPDGVTDWDAYRSIAWVRFRKFFTLFAIVSGCVLLETVATVWGLVRVRSRPLALFFAGYVAAFGGVLVFYQGYFPDYHGLRYLSLPGHLLAPLTAAMILDAISRLPRARMAAAFALGGLLLVSSGWRYERLRRETSWARQLSYLPIGRTEDGERYLKYVTRPGRSLPAGTALAAKDHGRLAFFNPGIRVVDLSGVIDPEVIDVVQRDGWRDYLMNQKKVRYAVLPGPAAVRTSRVFDGIQRAFPHAVAREGYFELEPLPEGS